MIEITLKVSELQKEIELLLDQACIPQHAINSVLNAVEEAELAKCERDWEQHQESLMENGPGPTLQEQQAAAQKFK
jgi:hypothetical protein